MTAGGGVTETDGCAMAETEGGMTPGVETGPTGLADMVITEGAISDGTDKVGGGFGHIAGVVGGW